MTSEVVLRATELKKTYGKNENTFHALRGIDLEVYRGETLAIVGKSGSGKSTLMHLLALMDKPSGGSVSVGTRDSAHIGKKELDKLRNQTLGFVFQQFFLNGQASVLDNVILPLKIAGMGVRERNAKGRAALQAVGLEDKAKNKAKDLSGGQKQRVVIARAVVNNPSVVFCDEPTGAVDSVTGEMLETLLFDLNKNLGVTLIIVTHDPELAKKCGRTVHIKDGLLVEDDAK